MLAFALAVLAAVDLGSLPLGPVIVSAGDLVRLVAVPVFGWAAYRDVQTRRVPNRTWLPLLAVGVLALALDALVVLGPTGSAFLQRALLIRVVVSLVVVGGLGYAFWWIGGFGGADAKALMTLSLLYPTYPTIILRGTDVVVPLVEATLGVFSLTILTNTVVLGVAAPVALAARNAVAGRFTPAMFIGRPVAVADLTETYGRLLETPDGFTRSGLDVDALRMYLRWRGTTLAALRTAPAAHRDPASLPDDPNPPGDGSLAESGEHLLADHAVTGGEDDAPTDGGTDAAESTGTDEGTTADEGVDDASGDPWGAARFFADLDGDAYGTTPEDLRDGLDVLTQDGRDSVWLTPGMPFIVPMFLGLLFALAFGDLLFALLTALGFV